MARGVIYLMSATAMDGMVKIGKTEINQFEARMRGLERDGYRCQQLKKEFAIIVDDYDAKETLIHEIFAKSRIGESELFALDKDLAIKFLSSLKGEKIYPDNVTQETVFKKATDAYERKIGPKFKETQDKRFKFWTIFMSKINNLSNLPFSPQPAPTKNASFDFRVGSSKYHLTLVLKNAKGSKYLRVGVWATNKQQYKNFENNKLQIEKQIPGIFWDSKPDSPNTAEFYVTLKGLDLSNESNWDKLMDDAIELLIKFHHATKPYRLGKN